jgi:hypothetical protein
MSAQRLFTTLLNSAFVIVLVTALSSSAFGQTVYVSSTTGADAFDGAAATVGGGSGPKATLAAGLATVADGGTISIEAGAYAEDFSFATSKAVTVVVTESGGNSVAAFTGNAVINAVDGGVGQTIALNSGNGSVTVSGDITFTAGTLALGASKLTMLGASALTVTAGQASGSAVVYAGAVTARYTFADDDTAGTELPADLNGGSLTVLGANDATFGSFTTGTLVVDVTATGTSTFGTVSVEGAAAADVDAVDLNGDDHVFGALVLANGAGIDADGAGNDATFTISGALEVSNGSAVNFAAGTATIGSVSPASGFGVVNAADDATSATIESTVALTVSGTVAGAVEADGDNNVDTFSITVTNTSGTTTLTGAVALLDGSFTNTAGTSSFGSSAQVSGLTVTAGTVNAGGNITVDGDLNNAGTIDLDSYTMEVTLTGAGNNVTAVGDVDGATSTIVFSGDSAVAAGIAAEGNLTVTGDGAVAGGTVGKNVTISGTGSISGALTITAGDLTMSGSGDVSAATGITAGNAFLLDANDVTAALTLTDGDLTLGNAAADAIGISAAVTVGGNITVGGTVTVDGNGVATTVSGVAATIASTGALTLTNSGAAAAQTLALTSDLDNGNGGSLSASHADAAITFTVARGSSATFSTGPNTIVDDLALSASGAAGTATLVLGNSLEINTQLTVNANTALSLGNYVLRTNGAATAINLNTGAIVTPDGQAGALIFDSVGGLGAADTPSIVGDGEVSNVLVMVGSDNGGDLLTINGDVTWTGEFDVFDGNVAIAAGKDLSPSGSSAEYKRNAANAANTILTLGAGSTFNTGGDAYSLTYYGAGAVTGTEEWVAAGISTLTTAAATTDLTAPATVASIGDISNAGEITLAANATVTGAITNSGTMDGAFTYTLSGDDKAHTNTGNIASSLTVTGSGSTMTGSSAALEAGGAKNSTITALTVGDGAGADDDESFSLISIHEIEGNVTVAADGTLNIGLVQPEANKGTADESEIQGTIGVAEGGSVTFTSNAIAKGAISLGGAAAGSAPVFDLNGNTLKIDADLTADANTDFGSSGLIDVTTAAVGISTSENPVAGSYTVATLPGLTCTAACELNNDVRVDGTVTVTSAMTDEAPGGNAEDNELTVLGDIDLDASATVDIVYLGGTITAGAVVSVDDLTIVGATTLAGAAADIITAATLTHTTGAVTQSANVVSTGAFTQTAGDWSLEGPAATGALLDLNGGSSYTAGTFTAGSIKDRVQLNGAFDTNGGTWAIPHVTIGTAVVVGGDAADEVETLSVGESLYLDADLTAGDLAGAAGSGVLNLGDGSGDFVLEVDVAGANVLDAGADGTVNYGADSWTVQYDAASTTATELPTSIATLVLNAATSLADDFDLTVDALDLNAVLTIDANNDDDNTVTVIAGGDVSISVPAALSEAIIPSSTTNYNLTYDGSALVTTAREWAATWTPNVTVTEAGVAAGVALNTLTPHASLTAKDLTIAADKRVDAGANTLSIAGDLTMPAVTAIAGGPVAFVGTEAQTVTGGITVADIVMNSAGGVTLASGDMTTTGDLTLTQGVITTGSNSVVLTHSSTAAQGFAHTAGGVYGSVKKTVDGTNSPNNTDRVEFPTGDADGNYRPYAITFNTPNQLAADPVLEVTYVASSPGGTNGLPVASTDNQGTAFSVGRYPEFHWNVASTPTVTPSIDYDVELRASGYAAFDGENIERTRAIRRADGSENNFWILTSAAAADNDNYAAAATTPVAVARNASGAVTGDGVLFTFGLEANLTASDPEALVINAGNAETVDLSTVFSGGGGNLTYTIAGTDADVATAAVDGNTLTVTAVGAGSNTFTVTGNDGFQSVVASVTVTVNAALEAAGALADHVVALGTAAAAVDATGDFSGGTGAYTYAVATTDAAVAGVTVDAGTVTVTFGVAGTATVTVTATDEEGDSVSSSFDVTVNGSIVAAGGLAAVEVAEGATSTVDVAGEFSGGNGVATYTYTAASSDDDIATVAVSGSEVTVTGVSAYTVAAGAITADNDGATITVTATDDQGTSATSTYTVSVTAVLGNVDGSGGPSPAAASLTLDAFLGLEDLTAQQAAAADYNGDGAVTPYDAALIFDAFFNGKTEFDSNPQADYFVADIARDGNIVSIPVMVGGNISSVVSGHFMTSIDPSLATVVGVTSDLGEGWMFNSVVSEDGSITLAFASAGGAIQLEGSIASIAVELSSADVQFSISAEGATNNNPTMSIDDIEIVELPTEFTLNGNYPNPFNPSTSISFDLPQSADVEIQVIDMIGRQVMTLSPATISAGANRTVQIDASRLASGTYFYRVIARMESRTAIETGRMMLVK